MVKYTLEELQARVVHVVELLNLPLPAQLAYKAMTNSEEFDVALKRLHTSVEKLRQKYGAVRNRKGGFAIPNVNQNAFDIEFRELLDMEVELSLYAIELPVERDIGGTKIECEYRAVMLRALDDWVFIKGMDAVPEAAGEGVESLEKHKKDMGMLQARQERRLAARAKPGAAEEPEARTPPKMVIVPRDNEALSEKVPDASA